MLRLHQYDGGDVLKVVLVGDVEKLGKAGSVVSVADGYARNYLFPRKLALEATAANLAEVERRRIAEHTRAERQKKEAEKIIQKLSGISCTIPVQAGEDDKLFGSVTSADIAAELENAGITMDKKKILLEEPIRQLGVFQIPVKPHPDVTTTIKVWVVRK
jgi:large subunit ribosomal protein L9